jgi:hypothetical protein
MTSIFQFYEDPKLNPMCLSEFIIRFIEISVVRDSMITYPNLNVHCDSSPSSSACTSEEIQENMIEISLAPN